MNGEQTYTLADAHQQFAKQTNSRVWQLLDKTDRQERDDDEMLYAVFASCYHWLQVGTGVHLQRGEYLIARVYMSLGERAQALRHALRCMRLTEQYRDEMQDFDIAFAYEGLARAYAMNGEQEQAATYYQLARAAGATIKDHEDKEIFDKDFEGGNWFDLISH